MLEPTPPPFWHRSGVVSDTDAVRTVHAGYQSQFSQFRYTGAPGSVAAAPTQPSSAAYAPQPWQVATARPSANVSSVLVSPDTDEPAAKRHQVTACVRRHAPWHGGYYCARSWQAVIPCLSRAIAPPLIIQRQLLARAGVQSWHIPPSPTQRDAEAVSFLMLDEHTRFCSALHTCFSSTATLTLRCAKRAQGEHGEPKQRRVLLVSDSDEDGAPTKPRRALAIESDDEDSDTSVLPAGQQQMRTAIDLTRDGEPPRSSRLSAPFRISEHCNCTFDARLHGPISRTPTGAAVASVGLLAHHCTIVNRLTAQRNVAKCCWCRGRQGHRLRGGGHGGRGGGGRRRRGAGQVREHRRAPEERRHRRVRSRLAARRARRLRLGVRHPRAGVAVLAHPAALSSSELHHEAPLGVQGQSGHCVCSQ